MGRVTREDYLHIAQGLAVGMNTRVAHPGDRTNRANLIVYNDPDKWSAYCQSCKVGHSVLKTHVRVTDEPKESRLPEVPTDMVKLEDLPAWQQHGISHFLARKGMDRMYLGPCYYSPSRERLIIATEQGYSGRDLTDKSQQKWMIYSKTHYMGWPSLLRTNIIVEDLFSMWKVDYVLRHTELARDATVVCSLGTGIGPGLMTQLMGATEGVVFFYDGDKAGQDGARSQSKRLRALGLVVTNSCAPFGLDPKDMSLGDIATHIRRALGLSNLESPVESPTIHGAS